MHLKDYYSLLEIETSATLPEIKKAYRRLALQYHPDKNQHDLYAAARFTEIKEAYEVLTNPAKKEYYLQQRWYDRSIGKRKTQPVITPVNILKQVLELDKYVSTLDVHRMDKEGLYDYIGAIIPDDTIEKLNAFNDTDINKGIVSGLLNVALYLPSPLAGSLENRLLLIKTDEATEKQVKNRIRSIHKANRYERNRVWLILLIVIAISLLIFFLGQ